MTIGRFSKRKKGRWTAGMAAALLLCASQVSVTALAADTVYVDCDVLRCRSTAEINDTNIVTNLYYGEKLQRVGTEGEWTVVLVDGKNRYVSTQYLSETAPAGKAAGSGVSAGSGSSSSGVGAGGNAGGSSSASSGSTGAGSGTAGTLQSGSQIGLSSAYQYAEFSKINSGKASLYQSTAANRKGKTVCVNAGHGTSGGSSVKTLCHPDGSPKVTGGTTGAGATTAVAVSAGMTFADGTAESKVTLAMAKILKDKLLAEGYDVLMIRESDDVQLDNVARTVIANNNADCHIALHWDSTSTDKGAFYMSVPSNASYRAMEPVASHWQQHNQLGECLVAGLRGAGVKIFSGGSMEMDLTQTSYSTIPSIDIELGDKASSHSDATLNIQADGLVAGIDAFFGF